MAFSIYLEYAGVLLHLLCCAHQLQNQECIGLELIEAI